MDFWLFNQGYLLVGLEGSYMMLKIESKSTTFKASVLAPYYLTCLKGIFFVWFGMVFCLGATLGSVQGLFLALSSGITSSRP